jgi:hypothetical protein
MQFKSDACTQLSDKTGFSYPGFLGQLNLADIGLADIFASMKTLSKRQSVRNPALASHLKPGQSLQLEDGKEPLVVFRRKRPRLTAEQIHAELDRLCEGAPGQNAQAALRDLRQ